MANRRAVVAASLLAVITGLGAVPVEAKVLAEGKPSRGVYWQKIKKSDGQINYLCRSVKKGQLEKATTCDKAKAAKP